MTNASRRPYELPCMECGTTFTALRADAKFCSTACTRRAQYKRTLGRTRAAKREKICEECGIAFTAKRSHARYCSHACGQRGYYRENRERINEFHRQWAQDHPEEALEIKRRNQEKHGDKYREAKKERYAEMKEDPEQWSARQQREREYYLDNRDVALERARQRHVQDPFAARYYKHGIDWRTLFTALWEAQDGKCYLCGDPLQPDETRAVNLDHDHSCCKKGRSCEICRRGLACGHCNKLIGLAKDDPARLRRIADNLEVALAGVRERMAAAGYP